ncbi:MAG: multi antimicrobial extrusion protein MatE [Microvirga sp.]|nr:multi antimicrobial extrusion protein MatE [Microvirga sp.]
MPDASRPGRAPTEELPRFVSGSTMRHVAVMTATGSIGLVAVFAVDLLSLLYISWLGDPALTAGVGLATIVNFFAISINVGLMIATGALVSRALGARERDRARRLASSACVHMVLVGLAVTLAMLPLLTWVLGLLGASGETLAVARRFLSITLPSNFLMALGMGFSGILRAVGDARRAMYVTLTGGIVTAALDPVLIFGFGLGVDGAAVATIVSRTIFVFIGWRGAVGVHRLVARPRLEAVLRDAPPLFAIALPAVLTNIATPIAGGFVTSVIARFGDQAIAASAIVDRLVPVAFGGLFALSGAIGPILGQNWGAGRFDRMRLILRDGVVFTALYTGGVWALLALLRHPLAGAFKLTGAGAELLTFFCLISGPMWFFIGLLFLANASFNNLGFPILSTVFNWGRATLGTMPLALVGAAYGPTGVLGAIGLGSILFGALALATAFRTVGILERRGAAVIR